MSVLGAIAALVFVEGGGEESGVGGELVEESLAEGEAGQEQFQMGHEEILLMIMRSFCERGEGPGSKG